MFFLGHQTFQSLSHVRLFVTPWTAACQASLSLTISHAQTYAHWIDDAIQPSHPLVFSFLQSISLFQWVSSLHQVPKYRSFSFSISPFNEYSGLISFRMDWFDLLAVQGTLKSLLQHHSSKASTLQLSTFFTVQLSHPYMTTGKTIALTRQTLLAK